MENDSPSGGPPPPSPASRRRLRLFAAGVLVFLVSEGVLLLSLRHDPEKTHVAPLLLADVVFAAVVCMILVFTLRKR